jgi:hypothetical protein
VTSIGPGDLLGADERVSALAELELMLVEIFRRPNDAEVFFVAGVFLLLSVGCFR